MLGIAVAGFVKSLKDFQIICRNCYRNFENVEKVLNLKEKESSLRKAWRWHKKNMN